MAQLASTASNAQHSLVCPYSLCSANISCLIHPVSVQLLFSGVNPIYGYFQGYLLWPRSERRLTLCVFFLYLTPLTDIFLWNWLFSFFVQPLLVVCQFINARLLLSKQQAIRLSLNWNKKKTTKWSKWKIMHKNGLTPNA